MAAGATGSVAMARARRQQRAVRISGRMAAAAAALVCWGGERKRDGETTTNRADQGLAGSLLQCSKIRRAQKKFGGKSVLFYKI
jgi:hypothetical protein